MRKEHDGRAYEWFYDSLYGVGRFRHKVSGALTLLETGYDCVELRRKLNYAKIKCGKSNYIGPDFAEILDEIASKYELFD